MANVTHITPKRRLTRQRSGFSVDGKHTGSECAIGKTQKIQSSTSQIRLVLNQKGLKLIPQFNQESGMVGFGLFVKSETKSKLTIKLNASNQTKECSFDLSENLWTKVGCDLVIPIDHDLVDLDVECEISIESVLESDRLTLNVFGANLDSVSYYEDKESLREYFDEQTALYIPEIYYLEHDQTFNVDANLINNESTLSDGEPIVIKSCNRCGRYLPIDVTNERNSLSFSNHCVKRSPCQHNAFSQYKIENIEDSKELLNSDILRNRIVENSKIRTEFGFQLECRVCKKFVVNAPLNPMRNAAQHREDSLRRMAIEDLLLKLLDKQWIFKLFRMKNHVEFDDFIWNKFDSKCFCCGKHLDSTKEMALDHTMPLVYFWPLDETATCLCKTCNSKKHDYFPFEFYSETQLIDLSNKSGIAKELLLTKSKVINITAINELKKRVVWFFDDFLSQTDYQKVREEKLTADLIYASIKRVFDECNLDLDLVAEYRKITGKSPKSVTLS